MTEMNEARERYLAQDSDTVQGRADWSRRQQRMVAAAEMDELRAERDRARDTAVRLEQELAARKALISSPEAAPVPDLPDWLLIRNIRGDLWTARCFPGCDTYFYASGTHGYVTDLARVHVTTSHRRLDA